MPHSSARPSLFFSAASVLLSAAALTAALPREASANATADPFVNPSFSIAADGYNELISSRIRVADLIAGLHGNVALPVTSGGGTFRRLSGTAFPASSGLYEFGGPRSTFEYSVSQAASGVTSIVMQTFITVSQAEGVFGLLTPANLPTLSLNGGTQFLQATTQVVQSVPGGVDMNGDPVPASANNPNFATFTWDLSSFGAAVDSFRLTWATDAHSNTLAFQVDQIGAVPEPETLALAAVAAAFVAGAHRRARKRAEPLGA